MQQVRGRLGADAVDEGWGTDHGGGSGEAGVVNFVCAECGSNDTTAVGRHVDGRPRVVGYECNECDFRDVDPR
jgi:predicted RNA-binding Zn-ribbon protein involved in translation (DUF1610 family)